MFPRLNVDWVMEAKSLVFGDVCWLKAATQGAGWRILTVGDGFQHDTNFT